VADQYGIAARLVQFAVGLVGDRQRRQGLAAIQDERLIASKRDGLAHVHISCDHWPQESGISSLGHKVAVPARLKGGFAKAERLRCQTQAGVALILRGSDLINTAPSGPAFLNGSAIGQQGVDHSSHALILDIRSGGQARCARRRAPRSSDAPC
jgi:hypothetical protein